MTHGAAHDAAQHITTAFIGGQHAFGDEEAHRAQMVGNDTQAAIARAVDIGIGGIGSGRDQRLEQVDIVIVVHALHDCGNALEAHAGVDGGARQAGARAIGMLLELHENQVPDFDPAIAILIGRTRRATPNLVAMVVEDFRARTAGAGIAHLPEIGLCAQAHDAVFRETGDLLPQRHGLVIVLIDGDHELVLGQAPILGQQVPGQFDGAVLEIIAEGEIAQHLEEGVVTGGETDIVEIVVLATGTHAFLRRRRSRIGPLFHPGKDVLELHHAGIGEHQRRIVARHQRARRDGLVAIAGEISGKARTEIVYAGHAQAFMASGRGRVLLEKRGFLS